MTESTDALATRWTRAAERAPRIALRRWLARVALVMVAIAGVLHLSNLAAWGWRTGQADFIAFIGVHALGLLLGLGLPVRREPVADRSRWFLRLLEAYRDRADRLRALGRVMLLEVAVLFVYPPLATVVAGHRLQWPAEFVVAVAASLVVWPLQRIAASQRAEASRLSALDP